MVAAIVPTHNPFSLSRTILGIHFSRTVLGIHFWLSHKDLVIIAVHSSKKRVICHQIHQRGNFGTILLGLLLLLLPLPLLFLLLLPLPLLFLLLLLLPLLLLFLLLGLLLCLLPLPLLFLLLLPLLLPLSLLAV